MTQNRPHSREKNTASGSADVFRRGEGLHSGPTGNADYSDRPSFGSSGSSGSGRSSFSGGSGGSGGGLIKLLILAAVVLFGGGSLSGLFGGSSATASATAAAAATTSSGSPLTQITTSYQDTNSSQLNTEVASGTRDRFTKLAGNGNDTVTVMVYMCGTDLESDYGMATADINEMAYATQSDKVNVILETGGAKSWQNSVISSKTIQRWKVASKGLISLDKNVGSKQMTDPDTLSSFITYAAKAYPADRYMLILWDHGGGSVTGYGYDQLYPNGTMSVDKISSALKAGGVKFDVIGFDACLMANTETAIAVSPYADYLIASEESEPGTGWYYTGWLSSLAENTSTPTTTLGKQIVDDFITASAKNSSRDSTSLSLTDLGEFTAKVPAKLKNFAIQVKKDVTSDNYQSVADARSVTKEFAKSNRLDQIDLVNFCQNLKTDAGTALADSIKSCVKYNRVNNMTNAYGLSIYFPYSSTAKVSSVAKIYDSIGMDNDYTDAVRSFATLESSGQIVAQNSSNSLFDILGGGSSSSGISVNPSDILGLLTGSSGSSSSSSGSDLLSTLLGGSDGVDTGSLSSFASFLGKNKIDTGALELSSKNGGQVLHLSEDQWKLIHTVELNVWADDGSGYIDLGLDNVFDFDSDNDLMMDYDGTWLTLNGHAVAYYLTSDEYSDNTYKIDGYIPALLNSQRVNILVEFTDSNPDGTVLGAQLIYDSGTEAKGLVEIKDGDTIDFLCDYYDYQGNYSDSYMLGDSLTVSGSLVLRNQAISGADLTYCYRLTDIYNSHYWTPALQLKQ